MFQPKEAAELGKFDHVVQTFELRVEEMGYGNSHHA